MSRENISCRKILSDGAKALIKRQFRSGAYKDRANELEPPFMAPSTDPDDYSKVRTFNPALMPLHDLPIVVLNLQRLRQHPGPLYRMQNCGMCQDPGVSTWLRRVGQQNRRLKLLLLLPMVCMDTEDRKPGTCHGAYSRPELTSVMLAAPEGPAASPNEVENSISI